MTQWNANYFAPALDRARQVIPQHLTTIPAPQPNRTLETSRTRCPQCKAPLAKVPSKKMKKKYFLKCVSGCADVVLFWSERSHKWEPPRSKTAVSESTKLSPVQLTAHACPVCQQPLEEYRYEKDGQTKTLLRCSNTKAKSDRQHKDVVYFQTAKGWWSPKRGELAP